MCLHCFSPNPTQLEPAPIPGSREKPGNILRSLRQWREEKNFEFYNKGKGFSSSWIWPAGHRATRVCCFASRNVFEQNMTWPQTRFSCQVGHVFWKLAFIYILHHNCHLFASKLLQRLVPFYLINGTGLREKRATLKKKYKSIDHDFSSGKGPREEKTASKAQQSQMSGISIKNWKFVISNISSTLPLHLQWDFIQFSAKKITF